MPGTVMQIRFGILTVSDRSARGERLDASGPGLADSIHSQGWLVSQIETVPDEIDRISQTLIDWADGGEVNVILTTGGTGVAVRDVTPEATLAVVDRLTPGLAEAMRAGSLNITPYAMLSRSVVGIRGTTLIVNLPGSPRAAVENFDIVKPVLTHAVSLLRGEDAGH